ncbi:rRNA processing protein [Aspergillus melleus]|uniref:rRNA processing protein n=1 Tax=Aspergillus melleus TaxID=138277 RepID=A0ACC3B654_9EURO|nr:rRNA processing protein [Aspergillus melleus]
MGASAKKKKEKQKDFQKTKLKVGKTKAKPENFTDTSFKSKSITLTQQSLTLTAPTQSTQFTHSLSLLSSKSDTQRRDSLSHLATAISSRPVSSPLPVPVPSLLPSLLPLILDANASVRTALLKLLRTLPGNDIRDHVPALLPYIRAGMTHLAADVRLSTLDVLEWLVDVAGEEVVSAPGGWVKLLKCFLALLGWQTPDPEGRERSSSGGSGSTGAKKPGSGSSSAGRVDLGKASKQGKGLIRGLTVLGVFLEAGLAPHLRSVPGTEGGHADDESNGGAGAGYDFPVLSTVHLVPGSAQPYAYLNLFGAPRDTDGEINPE